MFRSSSPHVRSSAVRPIPLDFAVHSRQVRRTRSRTNQGPFPPRTRREGEPAGLRAPRARRLPARGTSRRRARDREAGLGARRAGGGSRSSPMPSGTPFESSLTRRELLKAGAGSLAGAAVLPYLGPGAAEAQTPKRGGVLRLTFQVDPLHFDPHQTLSFATMVPLSFAYSRLLKVKAGVTVKPMTYPIEPDLAESWNQPDDTTYIFKLRKGVRWHPKPPVNGRELTADDVKYTYERFLTITRNANKPVLEYVDKIDALDKHTVKL